jgi:hypothetical protein
MKYDELLNFILTKILKMKVVFLGFLFQIFSKFWKFQIQSGCFRWTDKTGPDRFCRFLQKLTDFYGKWIHVTGRVDKTGGAACSFGEINKIGLLCDSLKKPASLKFKTLEIWGNLYQNFIKNYIIYDEFLWQKFE